MPPKFFRIGMLCIVAGLMSVSTARAQLLPSFESVATASGSYWYDYGYESGNLNESKTSRLGGPVGVAGGVSNLGYDADATATPGSLSAYAATVWDGLPGNNSSASAFARVADYFIIVGGDGLAVAGITAEVHGAQTSGDGLKPTGSSNFSYYLTYSPLDPFPYPCYSDPTACTPAEYGQSIINESRSLYSNGRPIRFSNEYETDFLFRYGQPFKLEAALNASAGNGGRTDLESTASFLLDLPEGASLISASGYGYIAAVPEPGTYSLLLLGLAGLALDHRRRAQRRR